MEKHLASHTWRQNERAFSDSGVKMSQNIYCRIHIDEVVKSWMCDCFAQAEILSLRDKLSASEAKVKDLEAREIGHRKALIDIQKTYDPNKVHGISEMADEALSPSSPTHLESKIREAVEALQDLLNHGLVYENGDVHVSDPEKAKNIVISLRSMMGVGK